MIVVDIGQGSEKIDVLQMIIKTLYFPNFEAIAVLITPKLAVLRFSLQALLLFVHTNVREKRGDIVTAIVVVNLIH